MLEYNEEETQNNSEFVYVPGWNEPDWDYDNPFQFCGICGEELKEYPEVNAYNRIDGSKIVSHFIGCKSVNHDRWERVRKDSLEDEFLTF